MWEGVARSRWRALEGRWERKRARAAATRRRDRGDRQGDRIDRIDRIDGDVIDRRQARLDHPQSTVDLGQQRLLCVFEW